MGWGTDGGVASPGRPPGDVQSAAARTLPGAFRGAGKARARPRCASGRLGEFWESKEPISGAIFGLWQHWEARSLQIFLKILKF